MSMEARDPGPLVGAAWLADELGNPSLRVFDTTVHLVPDQRRVYRVESGHSDYEDAHVPGAGFLDLSGALSDRASPLAFTLPPVAELERAFAAAGVGNEHRIVLYSTSHVMWATRVWWMLHALGLETVSVLDGGLEAWRRAGLDTCAVPCEPPPASFKARPDPQRWADRHEVEASMGRADVCTINALPRAVHAGESPRHYGRPGHIAGSVNVPYDASVSPETGTFADPATLRANFERVDAFRRERVLTYCGGGISATVDAFALTLLGHPNVAVYDGSLAEWVRDEALPMETGD